MNVQQEILESTSGDAEELIYVLITMVQKLSDKVDRLEKGQSVLRSKLRGDEA